MHTLNGGCHCGNISVALEFSRAPDSVNPRTCDCEYCRGHGAAWVSDAQGALRIRIRDESQAGKYRQGSGQAEFLFCANCGVLVAVLYCTDARRYAAVNAKAIGSGTAFGPEQAASPKSLPADEKARRWQEVWFADVSFTSASS